MVELLLELKADVTFARSNGAHPLYIACKNGHSDCARVLLTAHANPNQTKSGGWSSLHLAVQGNAHQFIIISQYRAITWQ